MKKVYLAFKLLIITCCLLTAFSSTVLATPPPEDTGTGSSGGSITNSIQNFGGQVYGQDEPAHPAQIAATIIQILLGLLGIVFVILMIYGGVLYMTSTGEAKKVEHAKNVIVYAVIGVVIIALAYALTTFIVGAILRASLESGGGSEGLGTGTSN
ncbi:MAG: pilin [Candidatus Parcubacteria bacterium]|nr:pilin [Candidatus Parcubacteria bacterium]